MLRLSLVLTSLALLLAGHNQATAQTIFGQNFESGLGGSESVSGSFLINNTGFSNNGTNMMGHAAAYGDNEYSFYQITGLVLPAGTITMQFDYVGQIEEHFDRFNVQVSATGGLTPPTNLLSPTGASVMQFIDHGHDHHPLLGQFAYDASALAGGSSGLAQFDLSGFAGQTVDIRFQFGSDESFTLEGFNMDNLLIQGAAVPEPTTIALVGAGVTVVGLRTYFSRKNKKQRFAKQK